MDRLGFDAKIMTWRSRHSENDSPTTYRQALLQVYNSSKWYNWNFDAVHRALKILRAATADSEFDDSNSEIPAPRHVSYRNLRNIQGKRAA